MTKGINHEAHQGHKEFSLPIGTTGCHTIVTWQLSRFSPLLRTVEFGPMNPAELFGARQ
jgi:hypothetical protein